MAQCMIILLVLLLAACQPENKSGPVTYVQSPSVIIVQFCPTAHGIYPTTFPEYGECIGNKIYAVYWDGANSWLTEVLPGVYKSTSTSVPCNFTVGLNCIVTEGSN